MTHAQSGQCLAVEEKPSPRIILGMFHERGRFLTFLLSPSCLSERERREATMVFRAICVSLVIARSNTHFKPGASYDSHLLFNRFRLLFLAFIFYALLSG